MTPDSPQVPPDLKADHTPAAIRRRLDSGPKHNYLRDFVYGAIDGTVTTFAVVSGVAGAGLDAGIVIVLGFANLFGDGFSMAAGNFLGTRAEEQLRQQARQTEKEHIALYPAGEREEIRQILIDKGFTGDDLERAVNVITSDVEQWVDTMLTDELGLSLAGPSPWKAAASTFAAFVVVGLLPLLAFLVRLFVSAGTFSPYLWSAIMTGTAFFVVGAVKSRFVQAKWYWSGLETLGVGGVAAVLAYFVGMVLEGVVLP